MTARKREENAAEKVKMMLINLGKRYSEKSSKTEKGRRKRKRERDGDL